MMKLWHVGLPASVAVDYDTFDAFVIRAESKKRAEELVREIEPGYPTWEVTQLTASGDEGPILGSFNAG